MLKIEERWATDRLTINKQIRDKDRYQGAIDKLKQMGDSYYADRIESARRENKMEIK